MVIICSVLATVGKWITSTASHINSYYISPHEDEILTFSPHKSAIPWSIPAFPDADNNVRVSPISVPDVEIIV